MNEKASKITKGRVALLWLKSRAAAIFYFTVVFGIFLLVYGLYALPYGAAGYAALLALVAGIPFAVVDFTRFAVRHAQLEKLAGRFPLGALPDDPNPLARRYADIILALEAERLRLASRLQDERRDAAQYYTLWAHQIKTPLTAMRLLLQRRGGADAAARQAQSSALQAELFRTEQYVAMVLQYQRLASMSADLAFARHSVEALVRQAAKNLSPLFIYQNLPLELGDLRGEVVTDSKWFLVVLEQLLTNALKYTRRGAVRVYSEGEHRLVVEDTGIGIAPEDLPRVFERGFTGAVGREDRRSTGIGLYLSREILLKLGFSIRLESEMGKGTRAILDLAQAEYAPI